MSKEQKTNPLEALERLGSYEITHDEQINYTWDLSDTDEYATIKQALERNIKTIPYVYDEMSDPECPCCREELQSHYNERLERFVGDNFCPECGQALDWGKVENKGENK